MYCSPAKSAHFWDTCDFFPDQHVISERDYHGSNLFQIYLRPPLSEVENGAFCWEKKNCLLFLNHLIFLYDTNKTSGYDSNELECILKYCSCTFVLCLFGPKEFWFHWLYWKKTSKLNFKYSSPSKERNLYWELGRSEKEVVCDFSNYIQ